MRKIIFVSLVLAVGAGLWGCADRKTDESSSLVTPPVRTGEIHAGELHNEIMHAFETRASLESIPSMNWEQWLETTLNSMDCLLYTSDAADERSSVDLGG